MFRNQLVDFISIVDKSAMMSEQQEMPQEEPKIITLEGMQNEQKS